MTPPITSPDSTLDAVIDPVIRCSGETEPARSFELEGSD